MIALLNILVLTIIIILFFLPGEKSLWLHNYSLISSFLIFIASLFLLYIPMSISVFSFSGSFTLISFPSFVINYSYMLDNISIMYIILSTLLGIIVVLITRSIEYRIKEKYILLFFIILLLINCFSTLEILFFYIFFEALLIPVFALIGIWGSQQEKIFAANQFFLYTLFGSFFMLTGIVMVMIITGTTNILILKNFIFEAHIEKILFLFFLLSFIVKVPSVPLHLWLPKAHVEAPTTGSVLLAGILLKLGSYGFLRFLVFLFPTASFYFLPLILSIAIISIILASFTVLRQNDLKRIIAYSSIAHMNYLLAAIFVKDLLAYTGSLLLQIAHGLSSSALFAAVGFLYDRYKSRNTFYYRGLVTIIPFFCFFFILFNLANLGFPGTVNFVSEMMIYLGLFNTTPSIAILTLSGIFLSAIYSFVLLTRVAFGPASLYIRAYYDLTRREFYILCSLAVLVILFGLMPNLLICFWTFTFESWFLHNDSLSSALFAMPLMLPKIPKLIEKILNTKNKHVQYFIRYYGIFILYVRALLSRVDPAMFLGVITIFNGIHSLFLPLTNEPFFITTVYISSGSLLLSYDQMGSYLSIYHINNPTSVFSIYLVSLKTSPNFFKRHVGTTVLRELFIGSTAMSPGGRAVLTAGIVTGVTAGVSYAISGIYGHYTILQNNREQREENEKQRQHQAEENEKQRQHQAKEAARQRAYDIYKAEAEAWDKKNNSWSKNKGPRPTWDEDDYNDSEKDSTPFAQKNTADKLKENHKAGTGFGIKDSSFEESKKK